MAEVTGVVREAGIPLWVIWSTCHASWAVVPCAGADDSASERSVLGFLPYLGHAPWRKWSDEPPCLFAVSPDNDCGE